MRASLSRRRLILGLAGAALSLVMVTVAGAQSDPWCTLTVRGLQDPWGVQSIEIQPTIEVIVSMSDGCLNVGTQTTDGEKYIWNNRRDPAPVRGDGFTLQPGDGRSFRIVVDRGARPGSRELWIRQQFGSISRMFTVGNDPDPGTTLGFCSRRNGAPCDRITTAGSGPSGKARCGRGETYVPANAVNLAEKRNFCNFQIGGVEGTCYLPNAVAGVGGDCATVTWSACREMEGEFHEDWNEAYCRAYAANAGNPYRYYCQPSRTADFIDDTGQETVAATGGCRQISPSDTGTYTPIAGGFSYRPPHAPSAGVPGEFDSFLSSFEACEEACGFFCVNYPRTDEEVVRGCASMPIRTVGQPCDVMVGDTLLPPYCQPRSNLPYYQGHNPNNVHINGKFSTQELCELHCRN